MIGRLRGEILYKKPPQLMLEVGGVGYELEAPLSTFHVLPAVGAQATLHTHLVVRDDAQVLYAFAAEAERALFRSLLKVSGVGAKMALTILSGMDTQRFAACVRQEDAIALTRLPGVGKKTAERLIVELRDRLDTLPRSPVAVIPERSGTSAADSSRDEAISALVALGYKPAEASRLARAVDDDGLSSEAIIRAALKAAAAGKP